MGKHDPTRDGDVHSDTAKQLDPKEFEKSGQTPTNEATATIEQLAAELDAAQALPKAWRAAFLSVPRHHFLPAQIRVDDEHGTPHPISRDHDPDRWLATAYRNVPILTQFDDGQTDALHRG